jgi:hypothetical protein
MFRRLFLAALCTGLPLCATAADVTTLDADPRVVVLNSWEEVPLAP